MDILIIFGSIFAICLMALIYALIQLYLRGDRAFLYTWLGSLIISLVLVKFIFLGV
jgi:hypothetical protein